MIVTTLLFAASFLVTLGSSSPLEQAGSDSTTTERSSTTTQPCSKTDADGGGILPNVIFPKCTATLSPESLRNVVLHGMACACDVSTAGVPKRDDYRYTPGLGGHKFHTRAATFNEARKVCNEEGGHLAIIDSLAEEQVRQASFPP